MHAENAAAHLSKFSIASASELSGSFLSGNFDAYRPRFGSYHDRVTPITGHALCGRSDESSGGGLPIPAPSFYRFAKLRQADRRGSFSFRTNTATGRAYRTGTMGRAQRMLHGMPAEETDLFDELDAKVLAAIEAQEAGDLRRALDLMIQAQTLISVIPDGRREEEDFSYDRESIERSIVNLRRRLAARTGVVTREVRYERG
ncbi:hypothetical protein V7x_20300 [Crateriforma conspicua]|uniref:Uncharacterized protein n=2 Tax=Planctomycetaceae TaxID=126 RepID=A0A5C6FVS8_9PLAN|nr:hypothetical protein V7x_20300 [Crateriforma conspicua]